MKEVIRAFIQINSLQGIHPFIVWDVFKALYERPIYIVKSCQEEEIRDRKKANAPVDKTPRTAK